MGQIEIADVEIDVERIDLADLGQGGVPVRAHQVAWVLQPSIDTPVERGRDRGVVQV